MEMTPELFPHTAQLLLLSTTETKREMLCYPGNGQARSDQNINSLTFGTESQTGARVSVFTACDHTLQ